MALRPRFNRNLSCRHRHHPAMTYPPDNSTDRDDVRRLSRRSPRSQRPQREVTNLTIMQVLSGSDVPRRPPSRSVVEAILFLTALLAVLAMFA